MGGAMQLVLGTNDGVWTVRDGAPERVGLAGKRVTHVASGGEVILAALPHDGLYVCAAEERRVWTGDARSCAIGPSGAFYVGVEPAVVHRSDDGGDTWRRFDAIDDLPTRSEWTFPPPPHEPHVLSIDFLPGEPEGLLAGIEVGGVIVSRDGGASWGELNSGVYVDIHSVRPDPSQPGHLYAVTGAGFYASENGGATWERRMEGVGNWYTIGMHIHPQHGGEILMVAGDSPPGVNGRAYFSQDGGRGWEELQDEGLRFGNGHAPVPLFANGGAWLGSNNGELLRAADPRGRWSVVCEIGAAINAMAGDGSPSSVMH